MTTLPNWARTPRHNNPVVATEQGWVDQKTREPLKKVANLPEKLLRLKELLDQSLDAIEVEASLSDSKSEDASSLISDDKNAESEDLNASGATDTSDAEAVADDAAEIDAVLDETPEKAEEPNEEKPAPKRKSYYKPKGTKGKKGSSKKTKAE